MLSKAVSNLHVKDTTRVNQPTQHNDGRNHIERPKQPHLACSADGTLKPLVICNYSNDKGHMRNYCVYLKKKLACEFQDKPDAAATKVNTLQMQKLDLPLSPDLHKGESDQLPDQTDK